MSENITPKSFPKFAPNPPNPLIATLPKYLKDPENYLKIRKMLFEILASRCSHSDPLEWHQCLKCLRRIKDHAEALRKLGFTSPAQYYVWRKIHEEIQKGQSPLQLVKP